VCCAGRFWARIGLAGMLCCHRYVIYFLINVLLTAVCPVVTIVLFSPIGEGAATYKALHDVQDAKWGFLVAGLFLLHILYLGDFILGAGEPEPPLKVPGASGVRVLQGPIAKLLCVAAVGCLGTAWVLWLDVYPSAPLLLVVLALPMGAILLPTLAFGGLGTFASGSTPSSKTVPAGVPFRSDDVSRRAGREYFSTTQVSGLFVNGLWTAFLWLFWVADTRLGNGDNPFTWAMRGRLEAEGIDDRFGEKKRQVQMLLWMAPLIVSMVLWTLAIVVMFILHLQRRIGSRAFAQEDDEACDSEMLSKADRAKINTMVYMIKIATGLAVLIFGCLWIAASIVGSSLRLASVVQAFILAFGVFVVAYFCVSTSSLDKELISRGIRASPLMKAGRDFLFSDWSKACVLLPVFYFFPLYLALSALNQLVRKLRGFPESSADAGGFYLTSRTRQQLQQMALWNMTSVFRKMQFLCIAAVGLQVVGGMGTNIVLAWVNSKLQATDFFTLSIVFFLVGTAMFMIPIVPGIAVYFFGGILIPSGYVRAYAVTPTASSSLVDSAASPYDGTEFWIGVAISMVMNYALKMIAITLQQKVIGEPMSSNLTVLQTVGVNKPQMRAIELILRKPGLTLPKIAILVGGPDWPVSVLTGILRLSLFQMLLGSIPVIFNVLFVTSAGSFRLREAESETWSAMSSVTLSISAIWSICQMVLAGYYIQETWEAYHEYLSKPRKGHIPLDWLDHVSAQQATVRAAFSNWKALPGPAKGSVFIASVLMIGASFLMVFLQSWCWDEFQVNDDVATLGLSFVKAPGWAAIICFCAGCALYFAFQLWVSYSIREQRRGVAKQLEPEREAWVERRLCEAEKDPSEDVQQQDLRLLVLRLSSELHELRQRVQTLEGAAATDAGSPSPRPLRADPAASSSSAGGGAQAPAVVAHQANPRGAAAEPAEAPHGLHPDGDATGSSATSPPLDHSAGEMATSDETAWEEV